MTNAADTTQTPPSRVLGQAVMDVRVAIEYGELNEKFWSHLDTLLSLIQVVAGALAFAGLFAPNAATTPIAGFVLAAISGFQLAVKPRERSIQFRDTRRTLQDLHGRAWGMSVQELDTEFERIHGAAPRGLEAFTRPAENRVLARHGFASEVRPLTASEKLAALLA